MKALLILCVALLSFTAHATPPWQKSPALTQLLKELQAHYQDNNISEFVKTEYMTRVDNISYFVRYIDKPKSPEYAKLEGFLIGLQMAHHNGIYQQIKTNATPWFCPKNTDELRVNFNNEKPARIMENLIFETLEKTLKLDPDKFTKDNYSATTLGSISAVVIYGLQTKYPCYNPIPEKHRISGWIY